MYKKQRNRLTMNLSVETYLIEKEARYPEIKELIDLRDALMIKNDAINSKEEETRIYKYKTASNTDKTSGSNISRIYISLSKLFRQADKIIESIDKHMEGFNETDPEFYKGYKSAREIKGHSVKLIS